MGVTSRFKGLDLIECLKDYGWRFVTLDQTIPKKKKCKKANGCLRRPCKRLRKEVKGKGEKERCYPFECRVPKNNKEK